ncbi:MAG TPA: MmgE/PrpD family protein [Cellulomonas sp.]
MSGSVVDGTAGADGGTDRAAEAVLRALAAVPAEVDAWAQDALADGIAVLVAGLGTRSARSARRAAVRHPGSARLIGGAADPDPSVGRSLPAGPGRATDAVRVDPGWAAAAGAAAASALDLDDGHDRGAGVHAGSTVLPALLAGAGPTTPLAVLRRALVAGYEVTARAGHLAAPAVSGVPYRASGYAAAHGAAAALTAVRGGTVAQVAAALRLAGAWAPTARMTTAAARESGAWAAATAVAVADLAVDPGTDPQEDDGAPPLVAALFDVEDDALLSPWSQRWECLDTYTKPYPCCRATHAVLDAVLSLTTGLAPEHVRGLAVTTVPGAAGLTVTRPRGLMQAQFALPFLVGLAVVHGGPGLARLGGPGTDGLLADPAVHAVAERVVLRADPAPVGPSGADRGGAAGQDDGGYPARVELRTPDGARTAQVRHARGSVGRPLGATERVERRTALLARGLGAGPTAAVLVTLDDPAATVGDLLDLVAGC